MFLKSSSDGDASSSSDSLFPCFISFSNRKLYSLSNLNLPCCNRNTLLFIPSITDKKNALFFAAASEHLSLDKFSFLFCLCLAHKQIAAVQALWSEKFPSKCVVLRLTVWRLLLRWNCFTNPLRPILLSSAMEEDTNTYTPVSADSVCWEQISNLININICWVNLG